MIQIIGGNEMDKLKQMSFTMKIGLFFILYSISCGMKIERKKIHEES